MLNSNFNTSEIEIAKNTISRTRIHKNIQTSRLWKETMRGWSESTNLDAVSSNFNTNEIEIIENDILHIKIHKQSKSCVYESESVRQKRTD